MNTAAEKIRQVVEEHTKQAKETAGNYNYTLFYAEENCAKQVSALVSSNTEALLDAIIEEMESQTVVESKLADSCVDQRTDYAFYSGKAQALSQMVENLRQARSDLLQQQ